MTAILAVEMEASSVNWVDTTIATIAVLVSVVALVLANRANRQALALQKRAEQRDLEDRTPKVDLHDIKYWDDSEKKAHEVAIIAFLSGGRVAVTLKEPFILYAEQGWANFWLDEKYILPLTPEYARREFRLGTGPDEKILGVAMMDTTGKFYYSHGVPEHMKTLKPTINISAFSRK
jgi:hypothetical protein